MDVSEYFSNARGLLLVGIVGVVEVDLIMTGLVVTDRRSAS